MFAAAIKCAHCAYVQPSTKYRKKNQFLRPICYLLLYGNVKQFVSAFGPKSHNCSILRCLNSARAGDSVDSVKDLDVASTIPKAVYIFRSFLRLSKPCQFEDDNWHQTLNVSVSNARGIICFLCFFCCYCAYVVVHLCQLSNGLCARIDP